MGRSGIDRTDESGRFSEPVIAHSVLLESGPQKTYPNSCQELNKQIANRRSSSSSKKADTVGKARFRTCSGCAIIIPDIRSVGETPEGEGGSAGDPVNLDENRRVRDISKGDYRSGMDGPIGRPVDPKLPGATPRKGIDESEEESSVETKPLQSLPITGREAGGGFRPSLIPEVGEDHGGIDRTDGPAGNEMALSSEQRRTVTRRGETDIDVAKERDFSGDECSSARDEVSRKPAALVSPNPASESDGSPQSISLSVSDLETGAPREMHTRNLIGVDAQATAGNLPVHPSIPIKNEIDPPHLYTGSECETGRSEDGPRRRSRSY